MTAGELKAWVEALPPEADVEVMLDEQARACGYAHYGEVKHGGWSPLEGRYLRARQDHPDRQPAQVAERLLK